LKKYEDAEPLFSPINPNDPSSKPIQQATIHRKFNSPSLASLKEQKYEQQKGKNKVTKSSNSQQKIHNFERNILEQKQRNFERKIEENIQRNIERNIENGGEASPPIKIQTTYMNITPKALSKEGEVKTIHSINDFDDQNLLIQPLNAESGEKI